MLKIYSYGGRLYQFEEGEQPADAVLVERSPEQPETPEQPEQPSQTTGGTVMVVKTGDGNKLNLRDKPKSGAVILGQYPVGTQVPVLNPLGGTWNYVSVGGQTGYMMDKFLKAE